MTHYIQTLVSICAIVLLLGGYSLAQTVSLSPLHYEYMTGDALPAGCEAMVDVSLDTDIPSDQIQKISFVLEYAPEDITITNIAKNTNENTRTRIEDDHLVFTQQTDGKSNETKLFSLFLRSLSGVNQTDIHLRASESFLEMQDQTKMFLSGNTYTLSFRPVQNCNPDVTPPHIKLLQPTLKNAPVDQEIVLHITDAQSEVNWEQTSVQIEGVTYRFGDETVIQDGNHLRIDPLLELTYGTSVNIVVATQDTAVFPGTNTIEKSFTIMTTATTPVCQDLGCPTSLGRQITDKECVQMQKIYLTTDRVGQYVIRRLFEDLELECRLDNISLQSGYIHQQSEKYQQQAHVKKVSLNLLSVIGRLLFLLTLGLKLRYRKQYHKEKKKNK